MRPLRLITIGDRTLDVAAWARECGLSAPTIHARLRSGWSEQDAVNRPKQPTSRSRDATDLVCPYPGCGHAGPSDRHLLQCRERVCKECGLPATNADRERQRIAKRRARRGLPPIVEVVVESAYADVPDTEEEEEE